jgi:class 3 adenylate cyclase/tetratricopeptide (TPR) repeat protein
MQDLVKWLEAMGMAQYAPLFVAQKLDMDLLPELSDEDLEKLGVSALGDRRRLLRAIATIGDDRTRPVFQQTLLSPNTPSDREGAERRQLTVMFCDLVGSTELANRLDPEEWRRVLAAYHQDVTLAVSTYAGYVAQLLGDGVLVYFGFPRANEDDAIRAVRAAAGVVAAVGRLDAASRRLQTRIGIATGLVVVANVGAGTPAAELSAMGEAPNLAARLQAQAAAEGILISDSTRALIGDAFELETAGPLALKGYPAPVQAWRVMREREVESLFAAIHPGRPSELVGRDSEVALLVDRWRTACEGEGQVVLLSGEAGIGKSRITQIFRERSAKESAQSMLLQCSPYHRNSTLYPVVHAFEMAAHVKSIDGASEREAALSGLLARYGASLDDEALGSLVDLITRPDARRPLAGDVTPQQQKQRMLQALTDVFLSASRSQTILLIVEDAHWIDPTTEEWIGRLVDGLVERSILLVITARPEYMPTWGDRLHWSVVTLNRLSHRHASALVSRIAQGRSLSADMAQEIVAKADGVPLFIEELTKTVLALDAQELASAEDRLDGRSHLAIPSTLKDSLMARLDRLAEAKQVAQAAAAIGRDFDVRVLAEVMRSAEGGLEHALGELVGAEIVFRRGLAQEASYSFKHSLLRDVAYESMLRSQRSMLHSRIAQAIESTQPTLASTHPELLALHHQEAGNLPEAMHYWEAAGDLAWSRSLGREAEVNFGNALAQLERVPETEARTELELSLSLKRGHVLSATEGYASEETDHSFERARHAAQKLGRIDEFVRALSSSPWFAKGRAEAVIKSMHGIAPDQFASLTAALRVAVWFNLGVAHFLRCEMDQAQHYLQEVMALDDVQKLTHLHPLGGGDPAIAIRAYLTRLRTLQGFLEHAESLGLQAVGIARERGHVPTIAWATQIWIPFLLSKGRFASAMEETEKLVELSERLGLKTRIGSGYVLLGRAAAGLGEIDTAVAHFRKGWQTWESAGGKFHLTEWGAHAADALLRAGRIDEARRFVAQSQHIQNTTDDTHYSAELLRLTGRLEEADGDAVGAESRYRQAMQAAERSGLRLFLLRASRDLARLQHRLGRTSESRQHLEPIYDGFTEGHDFCDLLEAKALLDALP